MKYLLSILVILSCLFQPAAAQQASRLEGDWKGAIDLGGQKLPIKTHFSKKGDDYTGNINIQGVTLKLQDIGVSQQDSVWFQFVTNVNVARFKGTFKNDSTIAGHYYQAGQTFTFKLNKYKPQAKQHDSTRHTAGDSSKIAHDSTLIGGWEGTFSDSSSFKAHFKYQENGYSGTVKFQVYKFPLRRIYTTKDDSAFFYFPFNGGGQFKGSFQNDSLITGNYYQNGHHLTFKMKRYERITHQVEKPYHHKDIIIKNDSIKIGGTLTWPKKQKADQLVIMISGSGAQNRDEEALGFKIFGQIADYLTRHGMATYRYDDRGVDESTGKFNQTTLDMLASDTRSIVAHFSKPSDHHFNNIILFGHSQGGLVAGKVAAQDTLVDKVVLMSSPSIMLHKVLNYQFEHIFRQLHFEEQQIEKTLSAFQNVLEASRQNENIKEAKNHYDQQFDEMVKTAPDSLNKRKNEFLEKMKSQSAQAFTTPQMQSLLFYQPASDLQKLDVPVLATFGGHDIKVLIGKNRSSMQSALDSAGVSYQINVFKNANHMYINRGDKQSLSTGRYSFVKSFLPTIAAWLKRTSKTQQRVYRLD